MDTNNITSQSPLFAKRPLKEKDDSWPPKAQTLVIPLVDVKCEPPMKELQENKPPWASWALYAEWRALLGLCGGTNCLTLRQLSYFQSRGPFGEWLALHAKTDGQPLTYHESLAEYKEWLRMKIEGLVPHLQWAQRLQPGSSFFGQCLKMEGIAPYMQSTQHRQFQPGS